MENIAEVGLNLSTVSFPSFFRKFFSRKNSLDLDEKYQVFYVDWGNEELVTLDRIRTCPESIRYIPWLANRVKFHREQLTTEEFDGKIPIPTPLIIPSNL